MKTDHDRDEGVLRTAAPNPRGAMKNPYGTPPIEIGGKTFGDMEARVAPFEDAGFDFARANEYLAGNPAARRHVVPDAIVSSCSECCMEEIDGKPNILGRMFRKPREGLGCRFCPVSLAGDRLPARKADGTYLKDRHGRVLSESEAVRMAEDGET